MTLPSAAATALSPVMESSLIKIKVTNAPGARSTSTSAIMSEANKILSATGSRSFPKRLVLFWYRARTPSQ